MASWGRNVDVELSGTGSIDANTSIISEGSANTAFTDEVESGNLIDLEGTLFVVKSVVDDETLNVEPVSDSDITDGTMLLSEVPKYLTTDQAIDEAVYITVADAQDSDNREIGIKTPGWTLYKEYGNGRRRVETLVAMKQTSV
jgi:hypothetical protein